MKNTLGNILLAFIIVIVLTLFLFPIASDAGNNEKGILMDYNINQYESESVSYLTFTIFNPELGIHRVRTVRIFSGELPDLAPHVGTRIKFGIASNGKYLDSITVPQGKIWHD